MIAINYIEGVGGHLWRGLTQLNFPQAEDRCSSYCTTQCTSGAVKPLQMTKVLWLYLCTMAVGILSSQTNSDWYSQGRLVMTDLGQQGETQRPNLDLKNELPLPYK